MTPETDAGDSSPAFRYAIGNRIVNVEPCVRAPRACFADAVERERTRGTSNPGWNRGY